MRHLWKYYHRKIYKSKYAICDELLLAPSSVKMCITNKSQQEQQQQQQQQQQQLLNS